jgi:hypothetical protein
LTQHVVLLRRDASLAIALRALLGGSDRVIELATAADWSTLPEVRVDAVVADVPRARRMQEVREIRSHYRGRLVLVLDPGDNPAAVPPEHACSVIKRPFEIFELWHLVTEAPTAPVLGGPGPEPVPPPTAKPAVAREPAAAQERPAEREPAAAQERPAE